MLEIITASGNKYYQPDEKAEALAEAMSDKDMTIVIDGNLVRASVIMEVRVVPDPKPMTSRYPELSLPSDTTELTDEQRARNVERVRELKRQFLDRRKSKKSKNGG